MKILNPDYDKYSKPALDIVVRDIIGVSLDPGEMVKIGEITRDMLERRGVYAEKIEAFMREELFSVGKSGEATGKYILHRLTKK